MVIGHSLYFFLNKCTVPGGTVHIEKQPVRALFRTRIAA